METPNTAVKKIQRQNLGAKVQAQKGNSPDCPLRSLSDYLIVKKARRKAITIRRWA